MNISEQKYFQRGNIKHFITAFFIFFLSHFLFLAYMGYMSKQKGVLRDAMVFVMEAYSFANFQKTKDGIRNVRHVYVLPPTLSIFATLAYSG